MTRSISLLASAVLLLSGCAFHRTPFVAYEGNVTLANTAVFASLDETSRKFNDSRIALVDGKKTPCVEVGCPYWVRVLPGAHVFQVRYTSNHTWSKYGGGYSFATLSVEIPAMKPRHVYVARYNETPAGVTFVVEDLGANPNFGITLGLEGANREVYRVQF